jgi:hypothetical protein
MLVRDCETVLPFIITYVLRLFVSPDTNTEKLSVLFSLLYGDRESAVGQSPHFYHGRTENLQLVNLLIFIMAGLIIVETIILLVTAFTLSRQLQNLDQNLKVLSQRSAQGMAFAQRVIAAIAEGTPEFSQVEATVEEQLSTLMETTETANQAMGRSLDLLRFETGEARGEMDTALGRFSQQTFRLHRMVLHPAMRASEIVHAGVKILKQTLSKEAKSPASFGPDKETFI